MRNALNVDQFHGCKQFNCYTKPYRSQSNRTLKQKIGLLLRTFGSILMTIESITARLVLVTVTCACLLCQITPSKLKPFMFNNNSVSIQFISISSDFIIYFMLSQLVWLWNILCVFIESAVKLPRHCLMFFKAAKGGREVERLPRQRSLFKKANCAWTLQDRSTPKRSHTYI